MKFKKIENKINNVIEFLNKNTIYDVDVIEYIIDADIDIIIKYDDYDVDDDDDVIYVTIGFNKNYDKNKIDDIDEYIELTYENIELIINQIIGLDYNYDYSYLDADKINISFEISIDDINKFDAIDKRLSLNKLHQFNQHHQDNHQIIHQQYHINNNPDYSYKIYQFFLLDKFFNKITDNKPTFKNKSYYNLILN